VRQLTKPLNVYLTLGKDYMVGTTALSKCRFIQPTKKGFNFLNLETNKCIFKHHLYAAGLQIKPLPKGKDTFRFSIYVKGLTINEIYEQKK